MSSCQFLCGFIDCPPKKEFSDSPQCLTPQLQYWNQAGAAFEKNNLPLILSGWESVIPSLHSGIYRDIPETKPKSGIAECAKCIFEEFS